MAWSSLYLGLRCSRAVGDWKPSGGGLAKFVSEAFSPRFGLYQSIASLDHFIIWLGSSNPQANIGASIDAKFERWLNHLTPKVLL